ncbi:hypothetical protein NIES22_52620 [Calothrix brevissima NIES-22]|nr:hypothetical protein NIES22_52620 [Calothrix brevissima NIES-22]
MNLSQGFFDGSALIASLNSCNHVGDGWKSATHSQIICLTQAIIESQTAGIQQMQQWYQAWSGFISLQSS